MGGIFKTRAWDNLTFPSLFLNNYRSFKSGSAALKAFIAFPAAGWPFIRSLQMGGRENRLPVSTVLDFSPDRIVRRV